MFRIRLERVLYNRARCLGFIFEPAGELKPQAEFYLPGWNTYHGVGPAGVWGPGVGSEEDLVESANHKAEKR